MDGMDALVMNDELPKSTLIIIFSHPGSTVFEIRAENVIPMQLVAVGEYLKHKGLLALDMQEKQMKDMEEQNKIIVPKPKIIVNKE